MTQSAVARFEAGGTVPTLSVLGRIAPALDADLTVRVGASAAQAGAPFRESKEQAPLIAGFVIAFRIRDVRESQGYGPRIAGIGVRWVACIGLVTLPVRSPRR